MKSASNQPDPAQIQNMFAAISKTYDRANDVIALGMIHGWRRQLVDWSQVQAGSHVLDCATGTGDLAFAFKKVVGDRGRVTGTDFCQEMLDLAEVKGTKRRLPVEFQWADVTQLPFEDNSFDAVSISYGIRNVADPQKALREMARVCRPQGHVLILETGRPEIFVVGPLFRFYFEKIMPRLGGWVSGRPSAYQYLNKSSSQFPYGEDFKTYLNDLKSFEDVQYQPLLGGASFLYRAQPFG